jgi:Ca2+-binding EF-hand superfamily protein
MSSAKTLNLTHDEAEELLSTLKKIKNEQIDFGDLSAMVSRFILILNSSNFRWPKQNVFKCVG